MTSDARLDTESDETETYLWGEVAIGDAVRSDEHHVELVPGDLGTIHVAVDGVRLFKGNGYPEETFTLPSNWEQYLTEDGLRKVREVYENERGEDS